MATLLTVYNAHGIIGRCDANCYNAKSADCDCVCGGANHGKGFQWAQLRTKNHAHLMVDDYLQQHADLQPTRYSTDGRRSWPIRQQQLFPV